MSDIHEVGDALWYAQFDVNRENKVQCPVCFGDLTVVMILGNGDHVKAPCGYCSAGYEGPRGWAYEHTTVARAEVAVITEVNISSTVTGQKREYYSELRGLEAEDLFDTEEEAQARAEAKAEEYREREESRAESIKAEAHRSFSWNVGYHRREAKKKVKEAGRHEELAQLCEARVPKTREEA